VLFNEPKLLKAYATSNDGGTTTVSVLFNEPKLLKWVAIKDIAETLWNVSVLFNEPKLLKCDQVR